MIQWHLLIPSRLSTPSRPIQATQLKRSESSFLIVQGMMGVADAKPKQQGGPQVVSQTLREHIRLGGQAVATEQGGNAGGIGPTFAILPGSASLLPGNALQFSASSPAQQWAIKKKNQADPDSWYGSLFQNGQYTGTSAAVAPQLPLPFSFGIEAVSSSDPAKKGRATVTIHSNAVVVDVTNTCGSVVSSGGTCQFAAVPSSGITLSVSPEGSGVIDASGLYRAPGDLSSSQVVDVTARHSSGSSKTVALTVLPAANGPVTIQPLSSILISQAGVAWNSPETINVAAAPTTTWTASVQPGADWVTIQSGISGTGVGTVKYSVAPNFGGTRSAWIAVSGTNFVTFTVTQEGPSVTQYAPTKGSVTPLNGSGTSVTFTATYSDANGYADIRYAYLLVNSSSSVESTASACFVRLDRSTGTFTLADNSGNMVGTPVGNTTNSQCQIVTSQSSWSGQGNQLTVNFRLNFFAPFAGSRFVWIYAEDSTGLPSGWPPSQGSWAVPGGSITISPGGTILLSDLGTSQLTATISPPGTASWSLSGQGSLSPLGSNMAFYTAPDNADHPVNGGGATVTATSASCGGCAGTRSVQFVSPPLPVPDLLAKSGNVLILRMRNPLSSGQKVQSVATWFAQTQYGVTNACAIYINQATWQVSLNLSNDVQNYTTVPIGSGAIANNSCIVYPSSVQFDSSGEPEILTVTANVDFIGPSGGYFSYMQGFNRSGSSGWYSMGQTWLP